MGLSESSIAAHQEYNGGVIFVSFLISVLGAQTTLELLTRRTHIRGFYNWFLLSSAAVVMGGVAIWCMHFVGNNSLTLRDNNGNSFHLNYSAGYTFASLVVAISCLLRLRSSASQKKPNHTNHSKRNVRRGQFAITYSHMSYTIGYVAGAVVIACCVAITALYIFFKLREQWANQWYKRLGSAILMAIAVCGMHYTDLVGTNFYFPDSGSPPPDPSLSLPALIGSICAIVVFVCFLMLYITIVRRRTILKRIGKMQEKSSRGLVLDVVFFDNNGRILVDTEGLVPMKDVLEDVVLQAGDLEFTSAHPFFVRLFKGTRRWSKYASDNRPSNQSSTRTRNPDGIAEQLFYDAAQALADELHVPRLRDLGALFDTVVNTHTITKPKRFTFKYHRRSQSSSKSQGTVVAPASGTVSAADMKLAAGARGYYHSNNNYNQTRSESHVIFASFESSPQLETGGGGGGVRKDRSSKMRLNELYREVAASSSPTFSRSYTTSSTNRRASNESSSSETEDYHIFLVKRMDRKEIGRLVALGYRFADTMYISKTMGHYLQIPSDHMQCYFNDMRQMADLLWTFMKPISYQQPAAHQAFGGGAENDNLASSDCGSFMSLKSELSHDEVSKSAVFVGLAVLVQEDRQMLDADRVHIVVDKAHRYAFPMTQLVYEDGTVPTRLSDKEKLYLSGLHGQTLQSLLELKPEQARLLETSALGTREDDAKTLVGSPQGLASFTVPVGSTGSSDASPISSGAHKFESSTSATTAAGATTTTTTQFLSAIQTAAERLLGLSSFGKPLTTNAKLAGEVIDIPPFALSIGPCQLILFHIWVYLEGIVSAINQSFSEPIKCLSLPLHCSLAYHITDQAANYYKKHMSSRVPESMYLAQQRVYQSTAISSTSGGGGVAGHNSSSEHDTSATLPTTATTSASSSTAFSVSPSATTTTTKYPINNMLSSMIPSLPPPPRPKRYPRLASLVHVDSPTSETASVTSLPVKEVSIDLPVMLHVLPTGDRFWWPNNVIEGALHDN